MPAQKERRSPDDERGQAREEQGGAETAETAEGGAPAVRLSHAEQEALRRRLREKFH